MKRNSDILLINKFIELWKYILTTLCKTVRLCRIINQDSAKDLSLCQFLQEITDDTLSAVGSGLTTELI